MQAAHHAYRPVLLGRRGKAQAQFRHGVSLQAASQPARAVAAFEAAIQLNPDHPDAHQARAAALTAMGRHAEAVAAWETLRTMRPDMPGIDGSLAQALSQAGRHADALVLLGAASQRHPGDAALLRQTATILLQLGRTREAVGALLLASEAEPANAQTLSTLAIAFLRCDDLPLARRYAEAAFQLDGDHDNAVNFGRVLLEAGAFEEAMSISAHAVRLRPASLLARNNHALALEGLGRHADALRAWQDAAALAPDDSDLCHKLATFLLGLGRLTPDSWALYERRLDDKLAGGAIRRWRGEDVAGKTVLLHAEQGFGDTLQFVRYAPLVAARGARVVLAVQPSLARLLGSTPGVDQVVGVGNALPAFDAFCPMLSLPAIFGTTLATVPPPLPYSLPAGTRGPGDLRVGLVWAGNAGFVNDRRRSVTPALFAPLTQLDGVRCHALQCGIDAMPPGLAIPDLMQGVSDFADTAARIAGLDLVIAVDTAVAHLAATMGKPVWLLSRFLGCWRWLHDRPDSPWYPTMRIYRQTQPNDWTAVIQRVEHDLQRLGAGAEIEPERQSAEFG